MSDITSQQLVVFSIGSEEYALPIGAVHEIIRYTEPRSVTSDVPWIRGVIGLRGKIIPIYDLASRMMLPVADADFGKIVIVETGTGQAGVLVGDVEEVLTVTSEQLEAVPTADTQTIESIAKIGDRLVILLNPEGLFAGSRVDPGHRKVIAVGMWRALDYASDDEMAEVVAQRLDRINRGGARGDDLGQPCGREIDVDEVLEPVVRDVHRAICSRKRTSES